MQYLKHFCFLVLLLLINATSDCFEYEISICTVFQNEDRFLKEWIDYHRKIGVQHFWLYNNNSVDNFYEVLLPYIEEGVVELTNWHFPCNNLEKNLKMQMSAFNHGLQQAKNKSEWVAFIDTDEFIVPINKSLSDYLQEFQDYSGVCINWQMYGSSNIWDSQGDMLTQMLKKAPEEHHTNLHVKSIVQPLKVSHFGNPHFAEYLEGFQVTENKTQFWGPFSPTVSIERLRLNHYWSRDDRFIIEQKIPRQKLWVKEEKTKERNEEYMEVYDDIMLKVIRSDLGYAPL